MFDLIVLALLFAAFAAAWGYTKACADLILPPGPTNGDVQ